MSDHDLEAVPENKLTANEVQELSDEDLDGVAGGWAGNDPGGGDNNGSGNGDGSGSGSGGGGGG